MAGCKFSETQFSFCFTFEYLKSFFPVIPLPIFPNTVVEGRTGGYDVDIDGSIFFQFKIPKVFSRKTKRNEVRWGKFGREYYVIKIKTNDKQFELLKGIKDSSNEVYYCTPEFGTIAELHDYYYKYEIVNNSAWFPIEVFPGPKSGNHELVYSKGETTGMLYSDPQEVKKELRKSPVQRFERQTGKTIYKEAQILMEKIVKVDQSIKFDIKDYKNQIEVVKKVHSILVTNFNTYWYPVTSVGRNAR